MDDCGYALGRMSSRQPIPSSRRSPRSSDKARPPELAKAPVSIAAMQIVRAALRPDVELGELSSLATSDPAFALRVLAMVNSALFGRSHRITDVRQACGLLGVRGLRNLGLGLIVRDMVPAGAAEGASLLAVCLRRAVAARLIAKALHEAMADDAFTAGMLLEVGLLARAREDVLSAARVARTPAEHRTVVERAFGHEEHPSAGAQLGAALGLPESVVEAIAMHHAVAPPDAFIAKVAWAAEHTAAMWEGGDAQRVRAKALNALDRVGVARHAVDEIVAQIPEAVTSIATALEQKVEGQRTLEELSEDAHVQLVELNNVYAELVLRLESLLAEKEQLTTDLQRANSDLARLAATDALTGLPNKRAFAEALARDLALADRSGTHLALVVVDLDRFKQINDVHGHQVGDAVLAHLGQLLRGTVRASDLAARYGGEEFVLLLNQTDAAGAALVAERIRASLARQCTRVGEAELPVTASFGVAAVRGPGCKLSAEALFARADAALYAAKRGGRNKVEIAAAPAVAPAL
jgi:diguanylate cyclase (GGDEF)-like protein